MSAYDDRLVTIRKLHTPIVEPAPDAADLSTRGATGYYINRDQEDALKRERRR